MSGKKLVLIIEAHQGFLRNVEEEAHFGPQNSILFSAITDTYIPLLNLFSRLEAEEIPFKLGIVLSPALCALLADPQVQKQYIDHLEALEVLGKKEVERCKDTKFLKRAEESLKKIEKTKLDFTETYGQDILAKFKYFAKKEMVELIPTAATYAYLPHYSDFHEVLNAQVETGLYSQRNYFGETGDGFWLPYLGWGKGFERVLRSYGMNYTVVDPRSVLFSNECPPTGIFRPVRAWNSLVIFAADPEAKNELEGEEAYSKNECYLNTNRDIGFDLSEDSLEPVISEDDSRIATGFKYWANGDDDEDDLVYDEEEAKAQVLRDAIDFYEKKAARLDEALEQSIEKKVSLVCTVSARTLGQDWAEGIMWLENLIRCNASKMGFEFATCNQLLEDQFKLDKINPFPCSQNGLGFGEDLLDSSNSWMMRYVRKASERMIDLTERLPSESSLKERLLNLAAKQILLAQSGEWPQMIHDEILPDFTAENFKKKIITFTKVFDALASNTVSTEWLTNCEKESPLFPWLNYRIFSRKK